MVGTPGRSGGSNKRHGARALREGRTAAPKAPAGVPTMPAWIADDPVAREAWVRLTGHLAARGTLTPADGDSVALACIAQSEYQQAAEVLAREGLFTAVGKPHPATRLRENAARRWAHALAALALTPVTSGRVQPAAKPPGKRNPFEEFGSHDDQR